MELARKEAVRSLKRGMGPAKRATVVDLEPGAGRQLYGGEDSQRDVVLVVRAALWKLKGAEAAAGSVTKCSCGGKDGKALGARGCPAHAHGALVRQRAERGAQPEQLWQQQAQQQRRLWLHAAPQPRLQCAAAGRRWRSQLQRRQRQGHIRQQRGQRRRGRAAPNLHGRAAVLLGARLCSMGVKG